MPARLLVQAILLVLDMKVSMPKLGRNGESTTSNTTIAVSRLTGLISTISVYLKALATSLMEPAPICPIQLLLAMTGPVPIHSSATLLCMMLCLVSKELSSIPCVTGETPMSTPGVMKRVTRGAWLAILAVCFTRFKFTKNSDQKQHHGVVLRPLPMKTASK